MQIPLIYPSFSQCFPEGKSKFRRHIKTKGKSNGFEKCPREFIAVYRPLLRKGHPGNYKIYKVCMAGLFTNFFKWQSNKDLGTF